MNTYDIEFQRAIGSTLVLSDDPQTRAGQLERLAPQLSKTEALYLLRFVCTRSQQQGRPSISTAGLHQAPTFTEEAA